MIRIDPKEPVSDLSGTRLIIGLEWAEKEIELIQDGAQIKREKDIYHHGPGPIPIICHIPEPPCFSSVCGIKILPNQT